MKITGVRSIYFETGMEGCEWAVVSDKPCRNPYDGLFFLKDKDRVRIYTSEQQVEWEGIIKKDLTTNLTDKTAYPYPRQVVQGLIFHWLQAGIDPEKWFQMFHEERKCELERTR